jgi:hypothetical protein
MGAGEYEIFAAVAGPRGQGGLELWVRQSVIAYQSDPLILHASPRVLLVSLRLKPGKMQLLVSPALDTSYPVYQI